MLSLLLIRENHHWVLSKNMWEVSPACGRTRYFPRAGKYPKGAGGGQRVHVSWPPPDPPLLSYSAPLASQGRAQRGSHPFPGGPLSPSAQSIPPPAPRRRSILGVSARGRHDSAPRRRNVPWHWGKGKYVAKQNFFCRFFPIFVGGTASLIRWGKFTNYSGNPKENHLDSPGNSFYDGKDYKGRNPPPMGRKYGRGCAQGG